MRVAIGGFLAAVNTFATQRMGLESFQRAIQRGDAVLRLARSESALGGFAQSARALNWEVVPLPFVFAGIAGKLTDEAYAWTREEFVAAIRAAAPLDGVFLQMHGTAASDAFEDCEGDLLAALRAALGEHTPIIVSLDGHANVTPKMVAQASMLIGVKTNPHYDFAPTGRLAARVMAGMFDRSLAPVSGWAQPAMAPALQKLYIAPGWPMDHLMRLARNRQARDPRLIDISILCGFFVSERRETGISVVVTSDREAALAREVAEELSAACFAARHAFHTD
ncbi:MAG: M81 family metallopeptidase, partial [Candidatus Binataceae bacterium]